MKTNKWKMTLLIWVAMFPFSTLVSYAMTQFPLTATWPLIARTCCLTSLMVPYMVFGALPLLTRYFGAWLQRSAPAGTQTSGSTDQQPTLVRIGKARQDYRSRYAALQ